MDSAFILKEECLQGKKHTSEEALTLLRKSLLVKDLLTDFDHTGINLLNRLVEFTEIPYAQLLPQVQELTLDLSEKTFCGSGFSYSGKEDDVLACYNAMITISLIKLNYAHTGKIQDGINWILNYQNFARGEKNLWHGKSILKYGGCMKEIPCYVGVVKSAIALSAYKHSGLPAMSGLDEKLSQGLQYILEHRLFKRLNSETPITKDILKFTFPFSYKTNIIEILRLMKENGLQNDARCNDAFMHIKKKQNKDGYWRQNSLYWPKEWVLFEKPGEKGHWLSQEIRCLLNPQFILICS